ncbi:hypothetical protein [Sorangium sp. So ce131]|uniref:hypothetical protein n=1 Tax=Sorangium sp. So ce131 TaxID=3133282 RepID=UPI003F5FA5BB
MQILGIPAQTPLAQASPSVQASSSSHRAPSAFAEVAQAPVLGSQTASWQLSGGWQDRGFPPKQMPSWQVSVWVQGLPSLHAGPVTWAQAPFEGAPAVVEQASQGPASQAVVQQTPSAQKPV